LPSRTMHPLGSDAMQIRVPPERHYRLGEEIWLSLTPDKLYFFDPETELAIYPKIPVMLPFEK
jgi:multiple sugar transport system ATP-binding protein